MVWAGLLPLTPTELPEALKRKAKSHKDREHKRKYGQSIPVRPEIAGLRIEEGHWEGDTMVGKRAGKEAVVLSLLEKKTETYLALRIPSKTSDAVMGAMNCLYNEYGDRFAEVFKTSTVDNGSEFNPADHLADIVRPVVMIRDNPDKFFLIQRGLLQPGRRGVFRVIRRQIA